LILQSCRHFLARSYLGCHKLHKKKEDMPSRSTFSKVFTTMVTTIVYVFPYVASQDSLIGKSGLLKSYLLQCQQVRCIISVAIAKCQFSCYI